MYFNKINQFVKKNSSLYSVYLYLRYPAQFVHNKKEYLFYKNLLINSSLVFDVGANIGNKTYIFQKLGNKVICIEPDNTNYDKLVDRFRKKSVIVVNGCISDKDGEEIFYEDTPGSAFNTLSTKWKLSLSSPDLNRWKETKFKVSNSKIKQYYKLDTLIKMYGKPDFIKIDVEGYELEVIKGLSQRIKIISFECNLPEFKSETLACIDHLCQINPNSRFNYLCNDEIFENTENMTPEITKHFILYTSRRYMEIFAFMEQSDFQSQNT